jgi:hypothetical protein
VLFSSSLYSNYGNLFGWCISRRQGGFLCRVSCQSNESTRYFELLILGAQTLEFQAKGFTSRRCKLSPDSAASRPTEKSSSRAAHHRQSAFCNFLENSA